ncbi:MAG: phosphoglycerate dehydrogenase [Firmicutes bacterium]|nr:phosphoglycerate dehydrogenase [Bacillota bacterium]
MKILIADDLAAEGVHYLQQQADFDVHVRTGLNESQLQEQIRDCDALLVRSQTKVTRRVIESAERLKVIGRAGVGVDNIDLAAATERGVLVVNAPDGNTIAAAELAFAMLLAVARMIPHADASVRAGAWERKAFVGVELRGKTLAVIGMGRIGTEVARRAQAFGMTIAAYDPFLTDERASDLGVRRYSLEQALEVADFITVHTPLTAETKHLLGTAQFARMKTGVRLVNCARGGIVDESALVAAMQAGRVAGAALDVYEQEPLAANHPLRGLANVIFTPHIGASTAEAQVQVAYAVAQDVVRALGGEPVATAVNLPAVSPADREYLEPWWRLGEQLGTWVGQLVDGAIQELEVVTCGELAARSDQWLVRAVQTGLLRLRHGDEVNYVNAAHLAALSGVRLREVRQQASRVYQSLVEVIVRTSGGGLAVAATAESAHGPRVVEVDGYAVDAQPQGEYVFLRHIDQPGMIGRIGMCLGEAQINIATMQVGRRESGGAAIMLLGVDDPVPAPVIARIAEVPGVQMARALHA